jgi:hypothetical protein
MKNRNKNINKNKNNNNNKKSFSFFLSFYRVEMIILLVIFILLWFFINLIPDLFFSLFTSFLGNVVLFFIFLLIASYNIRHGIVFGIIFIILYGVIRVFKNKSVEGFSWTPESKRDFLIIQNTNNPHRVFDLNMIEQNQASQEELDYFNANGIWPWSDNTKHLYIEAVKKNTYVKISPHASLVDAQKVYNETAILMILSYQTKEGQFLINGVQVPIGKSVEELPNGFGEFAYNSGLKEDKTKDIIRCNMDNGLLERIHYTGKEGIYGSQTKIITEQDYNDLENTIPGFKFVNGPCNPCGAVSEKPDYSCPFELQLKDGPKGISDIWKSLWGLN